MKSKKHWLYAIILIGLSFITLISLVIDKAEWDESRYLLSSYDSFHNNSYMTYKTIDLNNNIKQESLPYPNMLYSWSFGAFNALYNLPTDNTSRIFFTVYLFTLLVLSTFFGYYFLQKYSGQRFSIVIACFFILFMTYSFWKVRNTQIGASLLLLLSIIFLLLSYKAPKKQQLFEVLSILLLFLSCAWKEQIFPILILFPWLLSSQKLIFSKKYRVLLYYIALGVFTSLYIFMIYRYSINSGFTSFQYFYSNETSAWAKTFSFTSWISRIICIPTSYFVLLGLYFFITDKEYKNLSKVSNKVFIIAFLQYWVLTIFYNYQSTGYLSAVNYYTPIFLFPMFLEKLYNILQAWDRRSLILFTIILFTPLIVRMYNNYYPTRGHTIAYWIQDNTPPMPCIESSKIAAVNIYTLAGAQLTQDLRDKPVFEYTLLSRKEFLQGLAKFSPEIVIYYRDETEYPDVDFYMNDFFYKREIIAGNNRYVLAKTITKDIMVFYHQSSGKTLKNN